MELLQEQLTSVFEPFGSFPSDYAFERVVLVLCDDSVRKAGDDSDGWPPEIEPSKRRVVLEFVWHFPNKKKLPCRFWLSANGSTMGICRFVHNA